jgi:membrane protein YdbS with pleckstrin-like domain
MNIYKVSKKDQLVTLIWLIIFIIFLNVVARSETLEGGSPFNIIFTLLMIGTLIHLISSRFQYLQVDLNKISYTKQFITKSIQTIEAHQLEGVAIKQGPLGRVFKYGKLQVTGTGGIKISTVPFDDVYSVAQEIRNINPKLSDNQFKVAQDDRPNGGSTAGELEKLSQLLEKGLITREEFDSQKRKLLG